MQPQLEVKAEPRRQGPPQFAVVPRADSAAPMSMILRVPARPEGTKP